VFAFGDVDGAEEVIGNEELGWLTVNKDTPAGVLGGRDEDVRVLVSSDA